MLERLSAMVMMGVYPIPLHRIEVVYPRQYRLNEGDNHTHIVVVGLIA